jgi:hypothetical protein
MYNVIMDKPKLDSMEELNTFCGEFGYTMELEIPFKEMEGFVLSVCDKSDTIKSIPFVGIENVAKAASELLGKLAREH